MFYHNIDPEILNLGPIEIRYYGLIFAFGFLFAYLFLKRYKKSIRLFKRDDQIDSLLIYLIIGIIAGARLFEVIFYNPNYYLTSPLKVIAVWQGGLSFHGGIAGAAVAVYLFARKYNYSFLKVADLLSIPAALALFLGRIANFINGELYGRITSVPWAVKFQNIDGFRHPSQLYESAKNLLIFVILLMQDKKERRPGYIFSLFLILYSVLRFFIEFVREPQLLLGPLTMGQLLSIPLFVIGVILYEKTSR